MRRVGPIRWWVFFIFLLAALPAQGALAEELDIPVPLDAPADSKGASKNAEGIRHYNRRDWGVAEEHFREAADTDPKLAQAHYNLALALDQLGSHKEATKHFDEALKLAPQEKAIADSPVLKSHLEKMKKP